MFATFDTPFEVTTSELAIELLFPADRKTAELLGDWTLTRDAATASPRGQDLVFAPSIGCRERDCALDEGQGVT